MMSDRPRVELSSVQVVASVLAAVTGAVLTSYLGVGGTVAGTAVGSLVSTSGFAIYKHYLGRTKETIGHVTPVIVEHARVWTPTSGHVAHGQAGNGSAHLPATGSAAGARGQQDQETQPLRASAGSHAGQRPGGEAGPPAEPGGAPTQGRAGEPGAEPPRQAGTVRMAGNGHGGPAGTGTAGEEPGNGEGGPNGNGNGKAAGRGILRDRPRWLAMAATSAGVFVAVIAAITVFESATGKPIAASIAGHKGSGTTLGHVTGNSGSVGVAPQPTRTATPSQSATTPGAGQTGPQPSSGASTSPAPSSVPSPSTAPSVNATPPGTPPATSAPSNGTVPSG